MSVSSQTRGCNAEMVVFLEGKVEQLERELAECRNEALEQAAQLVKRNPALRAEIRALKEER